MSEKKRKYPRIEMEIPAEMTPSSARKIEVAIANLGPNGAFLKTPKKFEMGEKVELVFKAASFPLPFTIKAEILWQRDGGDGGVGVHFTDCPAYERAAIDDFCQQRLEETRGFGGSDPG